MIDLEFIERLVRILDDSSIDSLEIERGASRIRLAKTPEGAPVVSVPAAQAAMPAPAPSTAAPASQPAAAPAGAEAPATASSSDVLEIKSPMVGTFYRAPAPDAPAYVKAGAAVSPGDTLCIIEAMKLMNELESEVSGTIVEVCVENAQPVEYGQVLFRVDPR